MKDILITAALSVGLTGAFWLVGKVLPGYIVGKVKTFFLWAKTSPWFRDPAKPWRWKWLQATAGLLEEEIPEPGEGTEFYAALGAKIAGKLHYGSAKEWAKVLEQGGDALDTELDAEIAGMNSMPALAPKAVKADSLPPSGQPPATPPPAS